MTCRVPLGYEDFREVRTDGLYYVDKTGFLETFCASGCKVALFTRPRRFGKTLHMSMLRYFFDIAQKDSTELFAGLQVSANAVFCKKWMNSFPVVSLTLKGIKSSSFQEMLDDLADLLRDFFIEHPYLAASETLPAYHKETIQAYVDRKVSRSEQSTTLLKKSLKEVCSILYSHWGQKKKVILLLDEYDIPLRTAWDKGYYGEAIDFFKTFLNNGLKTNNFLERAVLTGCLRISKESLFSDVNNFTCFDLQHPQFASSFGFTQTEVDTLLAETGFSDKRDIVRMWYDGYRLGEGQEIYAPWDICQYLAILRANPRAAPDAYWVDTGHTDFVASLLEKGGEANKDKLMELVEGGTIQVSLRKDLNYINIEDDPENIWSFLYAAGFLTTAEQDLPCPLQGNLSSTRLTVPNRGIQVVLRSKIRDWTSMSLQHDFPDKERVLLLKQLVAALARADAATFADILSTMLLRWTSFHYNYEVTYQQFVMVVLELAGCMVLQEIEAGSGRVDLVVVLDNKKQRHLPECAAVFELKAVDEERELAQGVRAALAQIDARHYHVLLGKMPFSRKFCWGLAFCKKRCLATVQPYV